MIDEALRALAQRFAIDMPICAAVAAVLFDGLASVAAVERLLGCDPTVE